MSTDGRSTDAIDAPAELESAGFVRLVARADGDALAAGGLVARALTARGTPFQVTVGRTVAERTRRVRAAAETAGARDLTLAIGPTDADVGRIDAGGDRPATLAAVDLVRDLEETPDPVLALAGLVAAGVEPGAGESEWLLETARERGLVERRPGVAVPTGDPADGIAHSTRLSAPWSGDPDAAREAIATLGVAIESTDELDEDDRRAIGSLVALDAVGDEDAATVASRSIGDALSPYATPEAPFETLGGYADVLEAAARTEPGTGAALSMGHDAREPTLAAWRAYGRAAHEALAGASTGRYDGLFVVDVDGGPVEAVARIAVSYRSPEPTVLAVGEAESAIAIREDRSLGPVVERIARELEGGHDGSDDRGDDDGPTGVEYDVGRRRGYLRYGSSVDESAVVAAVRGVDRP
ncbi:exonuclease [Natrarchaeobius oligotrophus]|uniref:Exonuclease n=1 Tax=Natrarchaeobius chitinivorans TaxID=1679083 RepID=A0A3N6MPS7_NATCH|nr:exonuclease [Natrarchaeobius chitinivorans]RQG98181.1 exonuclease [Natrarchaeobius chitinivorans]